MTETTSQPLRDRPGSDVVFAVVLAVLLVVGGMAALRLVGGGDDSGDRLSSAPTSSEQPFGEPTGEPAPAPTEEPPAPTAAPPDGAPAPAPAGSCAYPESEQPASKDVGLPPTKPLPVGGKRAVLDTSVGAITITLSAEAPCTISSFAHLASKGFYDETPCHRLTTQAIFVLQCGDPTGEGSGGPGYTLPDEALEGATYPAGTVAMANTGQPGTGGSQYFLVYADTPLPPQYTPWGTVTGGMDVLQKVAKAGAEGTTGDGAPKLKVTIRGIRIS